MADGVEFDWDSNNIGHIARHHVMPEEAEQVLANGPLDLELQDVEGEDRFTSVGVTDQGRWLVVVTTLRQNKVRVVTSFQAGPKLIALYLRERELA